MTRIYEIMAGRSVSIAWSYLVSKPMRWLNAGAKSPHPAWDGLTGAAAAPTNPAVGEFGTAHDAILPQLSAAVNSN